VLSLPTVVVCERALALTSAPTSGSAAVGIGLGVAFVAAAAAITAYALSKRASAKRAALQELSEQSLQGLSEHSEGPVRRLSREVFGGPAASQYAKLARGGSNMKVAPLAMPQAPTRRAPSEKERALAVRAPEAFMISERI